MARVSLRNVEVGFPIFSSQTRSLKTAVFTKLGGALAGHDNTVFIRALDNISLDLADGDRLALIGHNGAGKTTFLRVVAQVYPPQKGEITIVGRSSSFTDITLGMDPEATGWQNIVFRCVFLGLTFAEAKELAPAIGEFSELGQYLDLPVRTYSTGMFLRLAFAISTAVQPDIVIMDEMIGTGDEAFIQKARGRMTELLSKARILILASHSKHILKDFCNKALWLEKGRARLLGPVDEVLDAYYAASGSTAR